MAAPRPDPALPHPPVTIGSESPLAGIFLRLRGSALALVTANLVPVYGVLALGWKVGPIMVFYWAENLVVGFFNILKMARAQGAVGDSHTTLNGRPVTMDSRRALILFFALHYGGFTLGHGIFVFVLFNPDWKRLPAELGLALLFLSASHGYSYWRNYIGSGEYRGTPFTRLFWQPYARVIVMHLVILAGGALAAAMGSPLGALLLLVGLKTLIDLGAHGLERRKFATANA